jgi:hypothetical protein
MKAATPVDSIGDPNLDTAKTGENLYELVVDWVTKSIKQELYSGD